MGIVEIISGSSSFLIHSHFIIYGNAANADLTEQIRAETETMWNEPAGVIYIKNRPFTVSFRITASFQPAITDIEIYQNLDPRNNYFRVEEFAHGNISFVDGLGCNSGYFKLENLYKGSTTVAHEYGHTLGLPHPSHLDIRGQGQPGIMYPRGTLVDPEYQYDPSKPAGTNGGTLHPAYRKVLQHDITALNIPGLKIENNRGVLGEFSNVFHPDHADISPFDFFGPPGA